MSKSGKRCGGRPLAVVVAAVVACGCLGCGTAEYERRLNAPKTPVGSGSAATGQHELYAPSPLEGTPFSVRVPTVFGGSFREGSVVDGQPVDKRRVHPPFLTVPGLKLTYEAFTKDSAGGKQPYYCYLAAVEESSRSQDSLADTIRKEIRGGLGDRAADWQDAQSRSVEGLPTSWKKIRGAADQEFYYVDQAGVKKYVRVPGIIELWMRSQGGYVIIIGWRVPETIAGPNYVGLDQKAQLVAGTVTVKK